MHPFNAIPIKSWYSDSNDDELLMLIPILEKVAISKSIPWVIWAIINRIKKEEGKEIKEDSFFKKNSPVKPNGRTSIMGNYESETNPDNRPPS